MCSIKTLIGVKPLCIRFNKIDGLYNDVEIWRDKSSKRKILGSKKTLNIWVVNVENIVISKLVETKTNSKYRVLGLIK